MCTERAASVRKPYSKTERGGKETGKGQSMGGRAFKRGGRTHKGKVNE